MKKNVEMMTPIDPREYTRDVPVDTDQDTNLETWKRKQVWEEVVCRPSPFRE